MCLPLALSMPIVVAIAFTTSSLERFLMRAAFVMPFALLGSGAVLVATLIDEVRAVDGIVSLSSRYETEDRSTGGSEIVAQHYVEVNGSSFKISPVVASTIHRGRAYRLYVSSWGRLLSMEPWPSTPVVTAWGTPKAV